MSAEREAEIRARLGAVNHGGFVEHSPDVDYLVADDMPFLLDALDEARRELAAAVQEKGGARRGEDEAWEKWQTAERELAATTEALRATGLHNLPGGVYADDWTEDVGVYVSAAALRKVRAALTPVEPT